MRYAPWPHNFSKQSMEMGRKFLAMLLCLVLALPVGPALACMDPAPKEGKHVGFFRPDIVELPGRQMLYYYWEHDYREWWFNYTVWQNPESGEEDLEQGNIADWQKAVSPEPSREAVLDFVYRSKPEALQAAYAAVREGTKAEQYQGPLHNNAFVRHALEHKDASILRYMLFAKECAESYGGTYDDVDPQWDYRLESQDENMRRAALALEAFTAAPSDFLRARYAYQLMRIYFAAARHDLAIDFFEQYVLTLPQSELKAWSRSLYAGSLARSGYKERAFIQFSLVFQQSARYRRDAWISAKMVLPASPSYYDPDYHTYFIREVLELCVTQEESLAALVMAAYAAPESPSLLTLLQWKASGVVVPDDVYMLTARYINFLERDLLQLYSKGNRFGFSLPDQLAFLPDQQTVDATPLFPASRMYDQKYNASPKWAAEIQYQQQHSLQAAAMVEYALESLAGGTQAPHFWSTASSYLAWLRGDYPAARARLARAETLGKSSSTQNGPVIPLRLQSQKRLLDLVYAATMDPLNTKTEARIMDGLRFFIALSGQNVDDLQGVRPFWKTLNPPEPTEEQNNTAAEEDTGQTLGSRSPLSPEQRWADRSLLHVLGHLLPMRYKQEGQGDRRVLSLAASETLSQQTPSDFTDSLAIAAMDELDADALAALRRTMEHPASPFETLLASAGAILWSPGFVAEMTGMSHLRRHNFLAAALALPQRDGPEALYSKTRRGTTNAPFAEPWGLGQVSSSTLPFKGISLLREYCREYLPESPPCWPEKSDENLLFPDLGVDEGLEAQLLHMARSLAPQADAQNAAQITGFLKASGPLSLDTQSRKEFAALMWLFDLLRNKAQDAELKAQAAYMYAKGLYNMGYMGNSSYLAAWTRSSVYENVYASGNPEYAGYPNKPEDRDYHRAETAEKVFAQVATQSANPELQAQALFMASLAYQAKDWTPRRGVTRQDPFGPYITNNPYFTRLHTNFSNTQLYETAYDYCSMLQDFVGNYNMRVPANNLNP